MVNKMKLIIRKTFKNLNQNLLLCFFCSWLFVRLFSDLLVELFDGCFSRLNRVLVVKGHNSGKAAFSMVLKNENCKMKNQGRSKTIDKLRVVCLYLSVSFCVVLKNFKILVEVFET